LRDLSRKLVIFDCDGVLTNAKSSWSVLHEYFGSKDNEYFAELYKRGLISYLDWMIIDVALMIHSRGAPITKSEVEKAFMNVEIRREARTVIKELKKNKHIPAVVSSGVDLLVRRVCNELGIELCLFNELLFVNDELVPGGIPRVPLREKPNIVKRLIHSLNFNLEDVVYIGDSWWDIEVFKIVPMSIAIKPCGEVCNYAKYVINNLTEILDLLNY
jgi:phosphoserine phosphatase